MKPDHSSNVTAKLVWRFKKQVAAAIYSRYQHKIKEYFTNWKLRIEEIEQNDLRNLVLKRLLLRKNTYKLRKGFNQISHFRRCQTLSENINKKHMDQWRKKFVFKVLKIITRRRKSSKK
jgi:hypothetical protein